VIPVRRRLAELFGRAPTHDQVWATRRLNALFAELSAAYRPPVPW
jgi:hypothetical protein